MTILVWYDQNLRLWTAVYKDSAGNQVGNAGYGTTKNNAVEDVKYQKEILDFK